MRHGQIIATLACVAASSIGAQAAVAATLVGQYLFQGNLASSVPGAPALVAIDPAHLSGFVTDTVNGVARTVYGFSGTSLPENQGGLQLDDSSGFVPPNDYSVDLLFEFTSGANAWRRIFDVLNRQSDTGFYVDSSNLLHAYPAGSGGPAVSTGVYHNVALTVSAGTTVMAYLDGALAFTATTTSLNLSNPQNVFNLFLDNTVGSGLGEWAPGRIALADFYSGALSAAEVAALNASPFPVTVPEPDSAAMLGLGLLGFCLARRGRISGAAPVRS